MSEYFEEILNINNIIKFFLDECLYEIEIEIINFKNSYEKSLLLYDTFRKNFCT